ncbi:hypothetical protein QA649_27050 [Bradyrhizobium sp. CB1717]|uniref:hypothetical protein n=1 Tax=Bradyrhizobium sp. CB1717 TaxID=3039154 RepID=UPI0024B1EC70|nr:hypothetical protein [Bradyrhizobium sp. CB1717]WFU21754.1 hypothetical protein QA649_27050 [Bradyrhizobium sp. CB1717]
MLHIFTRPKVAQVLPVTLTKFLNNEIDSAPYIGVFHSTNGTAFSAIALQRTITARADRDGSIFFFYGKPSYTLKSGGSVINEVSLAYHAAGLPSLMRVAPFDTGGLISGRYSEFFAALMETNTVSAIIDFLEIPKDFKAIGKFVTCFFGDNKNYINAKFCAWPTEAGEQPLLTAWARLVLASRRTPEFDPPAATIEIQAEAPALVDKTNVAAIIIPLGYLDRPEIRLFLRKLAYDTKHMRMRSYRTNHPFGTR